MRSSVIPGARMFTMVTMALMEPRIEEPPIRWIEKISIGKDAPVCSASGGSMVQPPAGAADRGVLPNTDLLDPSDGRLLDSRRHQRHSHHRKHARAGDDAAAHAAVRDRKSVV